MTNLLHVFSEIQKKSVLDLPIGWGTTPEEFKTQVVTLITNSYFWIAAPKYDIAQPDGTIFSFYPVFSAMSPEWGIISEEEIYALLRLKFLERVRGAYLSATNGYADHIWDSGYLAYGLENGVFSNDEVQRICFDHGDTSESYVQEYKVPNLLEDTMKEAFKKLVFPRSSVDFIKAKTIGVVGDCCWECC